MNNKVKSTVNMTMICQELMRSSRQLVNLLQHYVFVLNQTVRIFPTMPVKASFWFL